MHLKDLLFSDEIWFSTIYFAENSLPDEFFANISTIAVNKVGVIQNSLEPKIWLFFSNSSKQLPVLTNGIGGPRNTTTTKY